MAITELESLAQIDLAQPGNAVFVSLNDVGSGKVAVDVRRWYVGDDEEWHPTTKGISIPAQMVQQIAEVLTDATQNPRLIDALNAASKPSKPVAKKVATTVKRAPKRTSKRTSK